MQFSVFKNTLLNAHSHFDYWASSSCKHDNLRISFLPGSKIVHIALA